MEDLILVVDVGTSKIKVALFRTTGQRIALESAVNRTIVPQPLWAEQDPIAWWNSTIKLIRSILRRHRTERHQISSVAITGQMHGPILLDHQGKALGHCMIWQDRRAEREAQQINERISERTLYRLSGYRLNPYMTGPKLLWIKNNQPKTYSKAQRIVLPKDYIRSRFTGDSYTDWTDANGTGLFDMRKRKWAYGVFGALGLDCTKLPEIKSPTEVVGETTSSVSSETGVDAGVPVIAGSGDDVVAIGAGKTAASEAVVNLGTSCSTFARLNKPVLDPEMRLECFVDCEVGKWSLSGTTSAAAASVDWILRSTQTSDVAKSNGGSYKFLDELLSRNAKPSGLLFIPYLAGERSPVWNPHATGTILGLTLQHTRLDLIQSAVEGVCYTVRSILDVTGRLTRRKINTIRVAGAATTSLIWMRTLANVTGKRVDVPRESEATAVGAAMLAAVGSGFISNLTEASRAFLSASTTFLPHARLAKAYAKEYEHISKVSQNVIAR